jgi:3-deoxy-D-manno-octulosonic-acid transferase
VTQDESSAESSARPTLPRRKPPAATLVLALYHVVFFFGFLFYLPLLIGRLLADGEHRSGIRERMGYVPRRKPRPRIWVHGVSVGEVKAALALVQELERRLAHVECVVTSTTPTGDKLARQLFGEERVFYYPLDFGRMPMRALDRARPSCVLLMELELWPNFPSRLRDARYPGRGGERAHQREELPGLSQGARAAPADRSHRPLLRAERALRRRLRELHVPAERICLTGNLKYDSLELREDLPERDPRLTALLGLEPDEKVLVAGSTHGEEEEILTRCVLALEEQLGEPLRLILVPRHPERSRSIQGAVQRILHERGDERALLRLTELRQSGAREDASAPRRGAWLLVDTIGELEAVYTLANVVFVGGSLVKHGGQNMLEPVALGRPTLFGPHTWNFQRDVELLLQGGAVRQVKDEAELLEVTAGLFADPARADEMASRAGAILRANQGALEQTMDAVLELLRERRPELVDKGAQPGPGVEGRAPATRA